MNINKFADFEKINEALPHKKSIDQLKKIRKMMKGIDIGDRVSDLNKQGANIIYSRNPIDSGIESFEDFEKHNKKFISSWNAKGLISPFNESKEDDYETFSDVVKECFFDFEDNGWYWRSYAPHTQNSISEFVYPSFLFKMFLKNEFDSRLKSRKVECSGYIDKNGKITWDSQNSEESTEQLIDDFMTAIYRINGETGIPFQFSLNTRGGKSCRLVIYGTIGRTNTNSVNVSA